MGVLNIKTQNEALLIKHLHKFFNKDDIPRVSLVWETYYDSRKLPGNSKKGSFWWRDILKFPDKFKSLAQVQVNNGRSCFFWEDLWGRAPLSQLFPELFSFAKKKQITFAASLTQVPIHGLFHLPLSQQAHSQLLQLQLILQETPTNESPDKWLYIWNSNQFSVKKTYNHLSGHLILHPVFKWLW